MLGMEMLLCYAVNRGANKNIRAFVDVYSIERIYHGKVRPLGVGVDLIIAMMVCKCGVHIVVPWTTFFITFLLS